MSTENESAAGDSLARARRIDAACDRFEAAWDPARPPAVEDFLEGEGPDRTAVLKELVRLELDCRRRAGHPIDRAEYRTRYPELAGVLDSLWPADGGRAETPASPAAAGADTATHAPGDSTRFPPPAQSHEPTAGRYEVHEEIARGGMGVVHRAFEPALGREIAVKVMHDRLRGEPHATERFPAEARVTGQLQHPNVPPVFEVGQLADGSPFLAMKLVRGRTLAALLASRSVGGGALPRTPQRPELLRAFEQVCETVGYAHSQGVVHRDLKPANVMVGAFGEVQVMDWGLARVLANPERQRRGDAFNTQRPHPVADAPGSPHTATGSVLGTPAHMPPEQARGEAGRADSRADVFTLGGILCEILTGKPPFVGPDTAAILEAARRGDLTAAFARLDACGPDGELVGLCKQCLAADPADRPADGKAVADAVAAYRTGVEERARKAETERAAAEARAAEEVNTRRAAEARAREERRRRTQLALAASVGLLLLAGGGFAWYSDRQAEQARRKQAEFDTEQARAAAERRNQRAAFDTELAVKAAIARQRAMGLLALATELRKEYRFDRAADALREAAELAAGAAPDVIPDVERATADLAFVRDLDDIRYRKWVWMSEPGGGGKFNTKIASPEYRAAFAARGLAPAGPDPDGTADRIAASAVAADIVAAVDDWALWEPDPAAAARLLAVARRADPDPWRCRLRDPATRESRMALGLLARTADPARASPTALSVLTELMRRRGLDPAPVLGAARAARPADFELAFYLGWWHAANSKDGREIAQFEAARALRPDNSAVWTNLGIALAATGDHDGAVAACREAVRLAPKDANAHDNLGNTLRAKGDYHGAVAAHREAIKIDPTHANAHNNLGNALDATGDYDGAVIAHREAIRLNPKSANAHSNLGAALEAKKDYRGAVTACREAIRLDPKYAKAHYNLGNALYATRDFQGAVAAFREAIRLELKTASAYDNLGIALDTTGDFEGAIAAFREAIRLDPKSARAHNGLGVILCNVKRDYPAAVASFREAIRLDPKDANAHFNLGNALYATRDYDGAVAEYREAIKLDPKSAKAHDNLGIALRARGDYDGAVTVCRESIRLNPKSARAHNGLGNALDGTGDSDGAAAAYREAIRLDPKDAKAHANLGLVYRARGQFADALAEFKEAARLEPKNLDIERDIRAIESLVALERKLDRVKTGAAEPADPTEMGRLAWIASRPVRKEYALAFDLHTRAFAAAPKLVPPNRTEAAFAAVHLAAGRDPAARIGADEWFYLQGTARGWLTAALADLSERATAGNPDAMRGVRATLARWEAGPELVSVRDERWLAAMPADERKAWEQFWAEVRRLRARAAPPGP